MSITDALVRSARTQRTIRKMQRSAIISSARSVRGSPWIPLTLNTAADWDNLGGSYYDAAYKVMGEMVKLRGVVTRYSGTNAIICTLPTSIVPASLCMQIGHRAIGATRTVSRVDVRTTGELLLNQDASSAVDFLSLETIFYAIE